MIFWGFDGEGNWIGMPRGSPRKPHGWWALRSYCTMSRNQHIPQESGGDSGKKQNPLVGSLMLGKKLGLS